MVQFISKYLKIVETRNTAELLLSALAAFAFFSVFKSSPLVVTLVSIGAVIAFPIVLQKPEYGIMFLTLIIPFKYLNIKFVSIIGLNRLVIWGLLSYIIIRQFTGSLKVSSRNFTIFNKATVVFIVAIIISVLQTASQLYTSYYITSAMVKTTILSKALIAIESLLLVYIIYYLINTLRQILWLIEIMLIASVIIAFLGIAQYYAGGPPGIVTFLFDPEYEFYGRATSVFSNPNNFGQFLASMIGVAIAYFFLGTKGKLKKLFLPPIIVFNSWGLFLSFSRAAAIQVLFSIVIIGFLYSVKIHKMKLSWKIIVAIIVIVGLLFMAIRYYEVYLRVRAISCGARNYVAALSWITELSDSGRKHAAMKAIQTFIRSPMIGVGNEIFSKKGLAGLEYFGLAVHNQYLKILAEMGLLGFIPFLILLGTIVKTGLRVWDKRREQPAEKEIQVTMLLLLTGFITIAFGYLFCDSLSFITITGYLWIFAGAILVIDRQYTESMCKT